MIEVSEELAQVIRAGGFKRSWVADVKVDGTRVLQDIDLAACQVKSNSRARIRTQGSATLTYSDELGRSVVPEDLTSWMTPYATYLTVSMRVASQDGAVIGKVLQGDLKLVGVGDPQQSKVTVNNRLLTVGSSVRLELADAFHVTDKERFLAPSSPSNLSSTWAEIGRLTGLPLLRNVDDAPIGRAVTYQENRLDAVLDLGSILAGVPYVNAAGQVTLLPNEWGAETEPLAIGPDGTITAIDTDTLTDDGIYNQVVVRSFDDDQAVVLATSQVEDGPLRYGGPFGRVPYFASSQFVTTVEDAQAYADALKPVVSTVRAAMYAIQCVPDPRREVGDVVPFEKDGEQLVGRIVERTIAESGPMTLKVEVQR